MNATSSTYKQRSLEYEQVANVAVRTTLRIEYSMFQYEHVFTATAEVCIKCAYQIAFNQLINFLFATSFCKKAISETEKEICPAQDCLLTITVAMFHFMTAIYIYIYIY